MNTSQPPDLLRRRKVDIHHGPHLPKNEFSRLSDYGKKEILFRLDVVIKASLVHPDFSGDVFKRGRGEAFREEEVCGNLNDLFPSARSCHLFFTSGLGP